MANKNVIRPWEAGIPRRNIAVRTQKVTAHETFGKGAMIATGTWETGKNMPPFQYVEEYARKGDLGLIAFGAYNAFGLIGPEKGGVALVNEKRHDVIGTLEVPYSRDKRGAIFERIFGSRDWAITAREAGFGMRYMPNPGATYHRHKLAAAVDSARRFRQVDADRPATFYDGKAQAESEALMASAYPSWSKTIPLDKKTADREYRSLKEMGLSQVKRQRQHDGQWVVLWKEKPQKNPGGAAQGKLYKMTLGLYPSYDVNMQHLIVSGKFAGLKAQAIQMGFTPRESKSGYPWPGIYFVKGDKVLVLETVPPSHAGLSEDEYAPAEQVLRRKARGGKNPGAKWHTARVHDAEVHRSRAKTDKNMDYWTGRKHAEEDAEQESRAQGINPLLMTVTNPGEPKDKWQRTFSRAIFELSGGDRGLNFKKLFQQAETLRKKGLSSERAAISIWRSMAKNPGAAEHELQAWQCGASARMSKTKKEEAKWLARQRQEENNIARSKQLGLPNPGATKRWAVTVPYPSGKKKTFLFSAPSKDAARLKLRDMWFEGKFDLKGKGLHDQPIREGWKVKRVK